MNVSSVKNLNGETFSAVQDAYLTDVVSNNSANWNEISAYQANSGNYQLTADMTAYANSAEVTGTAQYGLTTAGWSEITGGGSVPTGVMTESGLEYDASGNISAYSGSAFVTQLPEEEEVEFEEINISDISAATDYVSANSANINSTVTNVSANSGAWGGSALPISAGPGVKISLVDNTLVFSNDETVLFFAGNDSSGVQAGNLTESIMNFELIRVAGMDNDGHVDVKYIYPAWTKNADNFDATGYEVMLYGANPINNTVWEKWTRYSFSALTSFNVVLSYEGSYTANTISDVTNNHKNSIREVIGINRIAGGN